MNKDCSTCICKEGSCYPSTTIFDKDKTCKSYDPDYEGYIAELEKENAELKEKYKRLDNLEDFTFETYKSFKLDVKELARLFESRGYRLDGAYQENIKLQEQLTKAKKIIKDLLGSENTSCEEEMFFEIRQKAEQFLQENE